MSTNLGRYLTALGAVLCMLAGSLSAQEGKLGVKPATKPAANPETKPENKPTTPARNYQKLYDQLSERLNRVKFKGNFTITGKEGPLSKDEYWILSAKKMEQGDMWLITARIKYGEHDLTVPMPLEIKWADETPVITLNKVTIPGLGTFSSRVVIDENLYAGTWSHDKVGGHLFGTIEKLKDDEK